MSEMLNATNDWEEWTYPMPPERSFKIVIFDEYDRSKLLLKDYYRFNIRVSRKKNWRCGEEDAWARCASVGQGQLFWVGEYRIGVVDEGKS